MCLALPRSHLIKPVSISAPFVGQKFQSPHRSLRHFKNLLLKQSTDLPLNGMENGTPLAIPVECVPSSDCMRKSLAVDHKQLSRS